MEDLDRKRQSEIDMVGEMISLYCRKNHGGKELCPQCEDLLNYARQRVEHCPFMETKTFCSNCKVHCYQSDYRDRIRQVMRFSGPRMLFVHPVMAIRHLISTKKEQRRLNHEP